VIFSRHFKTKTTIAAASLAALVGAFVTGCAVTGGTVVGTAPGLAACAGLKTDDQVSVTDGAGNPHADLVDSLIKGLAVNPSAAGTDAAFRQNPFDKFLDCYVGPVDAADLEQRLLRGHVVVTMLAMYGSYNISLRRYNGIEDDATTILRSGEAAEVALSASSAVVRRAAGDSGDAPKSVLPTVDRVDRVVDLLQLAIDIERPSLARTRDIALNLVAAVAGSPGAARELVGAALTGIKKATVLEIYGHALRNDAIRFLSDVKGRGTVDIADWEGWDRYLFEACKPIANIARSPNRCVPSAGVMRDLLMVERPPSRRAAR
jgi:hypothetical protein